METATVAPDKRAEQRRSLVVRLADRYDVDPHDLMHNLKATAFRQRPNRDGVVREPTNEEMFALLIIADKYELDPFTKEIFAYLDPKSGAIIAVVSVDGWIRLINRQPTLRSLAFRYSDETATHAGKTVHVWMEGEIVRSDRDKPITVREYFAEVVREVQFATPWDSHPNRMHRHKTLIQTARVAYGFGGLHDEDEALRILDASESPRLAQRMPDRIARINAEVTGVPVPPTVIVPAEAETKPDTTAEYDAFVRAADVTDEVVQVVNDESLGKWPNVAKGTGPLGVADVAAAIAKASTLDELALATDLIRSLPKMADQRAMNLAAADKRKKLSDDGSDDAKN